MKLPTNKCALCNREKGRHKAVTLNCPIGRGNFPQYKIAEFFTPKKKRKSNKNDNNTFIL